MSDVNFYKNLKALRLPITEVFQPHYFTDVPGDWYIIIADIKNSTAAVNAGNHNNVNLVAAGSLIAALNVARKNNIEIPFFFGGDGGTILIPGEILADVIAGLNAHNTNSMKSFQLEMHVGSIRVKDIVDKGHFLKIAKVQFGKGFHKAIVLGDALKVAEDLIKRSSPGTVKADDAGELNLEGLECRWDRVKPPAEENEIVCYLIEARDPGRQATVYGNVLMKIDEIYGSIETRNPLSQDRLKLLVSFDKIKREMKVKYNKFRMNYIVKTLINTFLGRLYFKYNWKVNDLRGKEYIDQVISNADTLTIDGRINTIITGRMDKRILLVEYLAAQQKEGTLIFGHHISRESVMTCYIENRDSKHIHFVDGSDGGYTEAAKEFKRQLSGSRQPR